MCKLTLNESLHLHVQTHPCSRHYKPPPSLKLILHTPSFWTNLIRGSVSSGILNDDSMFFFHVTPVDGAVFEDLVTIAASGWGLKLKLS